VAVGVQVEDLHDVGENVFVGHDLERAAAVVSDGAVADGGGEGAHGQALPVLRKADVAQGADGFKRAVEDRVLGIPGGGQPGDERNHGNDRRDANECSHTYISRHQETDQ
jgi:hypothetical protein